VSVSASYTYNRATDNTTYGCCLARTATTYTAVVSDPRDLSGSWGPSDTDFRHKVVASGALGLPWGVRLGGRYVGSNGRTFSAVINGDAATQRPWCIASARAIVGGAPSPRTTAR
jgi:hypothetical protein